MFAAFAAAIWSYMHYKAGVSKTDYPSYLDWVRSFFPNRDGNGEAT